MSHSLKRLGFIAAAAVLTFSACATKTPPTTSESTPPPVTREFRGVWVATVANIDWPSKPGLSVEEQKAELIKLLDRSVELKLNTIVFQVRPACDAYYPSKIEPWTPWLTGEMGKAPEPFYDPLEFAIAESHKRNLELHAWFNPYRALLKGKLDKTIAPNHISKTHPEFVRDYGSFLWLDPTDEGARKYSLSVIEDVVKRYDVDGVQFDDYFYPYPEKDTNQNVISFPDDQNWTKYQAKGGKLSRADWRRENVNIFIKSVWQCVKKEKPWVKFGISPFGVWKAGAPCPAKCDSYNDLFADARKWMQEGWLDYCSPQLYWKSDFPERPYTGLLQWWADENTLGRHLWPGHFDNQIGNRDKDGNVLMTTEDIVAQCANSRKAGCAGDIHFSMTAFLKNRGELNDQLSQIYAEPALVPASPWLSKSRPATPKPTAKVNGANLWLNWKDGTGKVGQWVMQKKVASQWTTQLLPGNQTSLTITGKSGGALPQVVALTAIDRYGNASRPYIWTNNQSAK